ncbi:MAG: RiPP maturation radical SAM C-methyltransferase [Desulfobacteraceae bacterium]
MMTITLISTPWPFFDRPSIQLGALKAYLNASFADIRAEARHSYLSVAAELGYKRYGAVSERTRLAEIPYAALLYPEKAGELEWLWDRMSRGSMRLNGVGLEEICTSLERTSERVLDEIAAHCPDLVGFSLCLAQLTSTVYFIRGLRTRGVSAPVAVGGSGCAGRLGLSLLRTFSEVDFVVTGEGERPLGHLVGHLLEHQDEDPPPFPGLLARTGEETAGWEQLRSQVESLDQLPFPDFEDYFSLLKSLGSEPPFLPRLPMEISRGCWWRTPRGGGGEKGCRFCNLNLQWEGYRAKSPERVAREVDELTEKHRLLTVSFTDNLLPARGQERLFRCLAELPKDLSLFAEMRSTVSPRAQAAMAEAGMRRVQVGIEALSSSLLRKMRKGTTAMVNLEIMKRSEAPDMPELASNLILQFPGSGDQEVQETLENLEFASVFKPLKPIPFWLGFDSPVWRRPGDYGIQRVFNHRFYARLFPDSVLRTLITMIQGYHGEVRRQQRLWRPVKERVRRWQRDYYDLHRAPGSEPILTYRDGGTFLIIYQRRKQNDPMTHRLVGPSREIYLFCGRSRSIKRIVQQFERFGQDRLQGFLQMMVDKRLMFREGDRYLSLAVPARGLGREERSRDVY